MSTEQRGTKRKASSDDSLQNILVKLSDFIVSDLAKTIDGDSIEHCGSAAISLLESQPDVALDLAHQKLHTWPYREVPECWRRMYEDASLALVAKIVLQHSTGFEAEADEYLDAENGDAEWITEVVKLLDMGIQLTGTPCRSKTFETVFLNLQKAIDSSRSSRDIDQKFPIAVPTALELESQCWIPRVKSVLSFEDFQAHLDRANTPIVIPGIVDTWPAYANWTSTAYWMDKTLGGRRLVPVEVGSQYTDDDWSQRIMTFAEFMKTHLLANADNTPNGEQDRDKVGYLAQHDLFSQIPSLRADIRTPDYCYCSPPQPSSSRLTNGEAELDQELDEPLMNIWLGPAGTKTPLHTDPYSNILAQVMGYKYVRLYPPKETSKLYPMATDENGVDMSNTSSVDISFTRMQQSFEDNYIERLKMQREKYPSFEEAKFVEAILGPGECLYIPQGWWHYVESLSIAASVSFWWK